jgi:hypothetical protein
MAPYEQIGTRPHPNVSKYPYLRPIPIYPCVYDALLKCHASDPQPLNQFYGQSVYCVHKRQLGKREIRKYNLTPACEMIAAEKSRKR